MKSFINSILKKRLFYHYVFWITLIISYMITHYYLVENASTGYYLLSVLTRNGLLILLVYGNINFLLPLYYHRKKYIQYGFSLLLLMLAYSFLSTSYILHLYKDILHYQRGI